MRSSQNSAEKVNKPMKKTKILAILMATAMLTSCGKAPVEETTEETTITEETTTTVQETTTESTAAPTATPTPRPTETSAAEPEPSETSAAESDQTYITAGDEPHEDYYVTDFSFSEDGTSGTFTVSTYDTYSADYVMALEVGDELPDGTIIESIDYRDGYVTINSYEYDFWLIETGEYILRDDIGKAYTTTVGEMTFDISDDVLIIDGAIPIGHEGIWIHDDTDYYFESVNEFVDILDDDSVWYTPPLFIRVVDGEISIIVINPDCHEPWRER